MPLSQGRGGYQRIIFPVTKRHGKHFVRTEAHQSEHLQLLWCSFWSHGLKILTKDKLLFTANVKLKILCFPFSFTSTVGLPFFILTLQHSPFKRGFFCNDESIRYPLKEDTISHQLLGGVMIPFTLVVVSGPASAIGTLFIKHFSSKQQLKAL